jgi:hypothetical protein
MSWIGCVLGMSLCTLAVPTSLIELRPELMPPHNTLPIHVARGRVGPARRAACHSFPAHASPLALSVRCKASRSSQFSMLRERYATLAAPVRLCSYSVGPVHHGGDRNLSR